MTITNEPAAQQRAAESEAAAIRENLMAFARGERFSFVAHFPLGLSQTGLEDDIHTLFLSSLGEIKAGDGFLCVPGGIKLFVAETTYPDINDGKPCHITYSSEPVEI